MLVYCNYNADKGDEEEGEGAVKYGYYYESSKSSKSSFSYVTDDIDVLACPCLASELCSDCTILSPSVTLVSFKFVLLFF